MPVRTWSNEHFSELSWHDNHVHGFVIRAGAHGAGELELDLDFILEWLPSGGTRCMFRMAPATLTFHEVTDLDVALSYTSPSAALGPFSLQSIGREPFVHPNGHASFRWNLAVNWPSGSITFISSGFTQVLRAEPVESSEQYLTPTQRGLAPFR